MDEGAHRVDREVGDGELPGVVGRVSAGPERMPELVEATADGGSTWSTREGIGNLPEPGSRAP